MIRYTPGVMYCRLGRKIGNPAQGQPRVSEISHKVPKANNVRATVVPCLACIFLFQIDGRCTSGKLRLIGIMCRAGSCYCVYITVFHSIRKHTQIVHSLRIRKVPELKFGTRSWKGKRLQYHKGCVLEGHSGSPAVDLPLRPSSEKNP